MNEPAEWRKQQDLIFQEIEEIERLESQALAAAGEAIRSARLDDRHRFIIRLSRSKVFQGLMRTVSAEQRGEIVRACIQALGDKDGPGTQI